VALIAPVIPVGAKACALAMFPEPPGAGWFVESVNATVPDECTTPLLSARSTGYELPAAIGREVRGSF
jgi:hypothetical protein